MITLSIDSTMNGCSVGVFQDNETLSTRSLEMSRGQAEHLIPMINDCLTKANISYDNLNRIAVTKGPGAFTGMRIGLATAKSFGLALSIPVIGVCTFQAVLNTYLKSPDHQSHDFYGVLLETKRKDYYFQLFENHDPRSDKMVTSAEEIQKHIRDKSCVLIGDVAQRFQEDITDHQNMTFHDTPLPSPYAVMRVAMESLESGTDPVYLRAPEIGTPKNPPRKLKSIL